MNRRDEIAIERAAELRRHREQERAEMDARAAECPRTIATAGPEFVRELGRMVGAVMRAAMRAQTRRGRR